VCVCSQQHGALPQARAFQCQAYNAHPRVSAYRARSRCRRPTPPPVPSQLHRSHPCIPRIDRSNARSSATTPPARRGRYLAPGSHHHTRSTPQGTRHGIPMIVIYACRSLPGGSRNTNDTACRRGSSGIRYRNSSVSKIWPRARSTSLSSTCPNLLSCWQGH